MPARAPVSPLLTALYARLDGAVTYNGGANVAPVAVDPSRLSFPFIQLGTFLFSEAEAEYHGIARWQIEIWTEVPQWDQAQEISDGVILRLGGWLPDLSGSNFRAIRSRRGDVGGALDLSPLGVLSPHITVEWIWAISDIS